MQLLQAAPPPGLGGKSCEPDQTPLLARDGRGDGVDHHGCHLELGITVADIVAAGDPGEIGPERPDIAMIVLGQQQANRPIKPGVGVRGDELRSERQIPEQAQRRRPKLDSGVGGEVRLDRSP